MMIRPMSQKLADAEWEDIRHGHLTLRVNDRGQYVAEDPDGRSGRGATPGQAIDDLRA